MINETDRQAIMERLRSQEPGLFVAHARTDVHRLLLALDEHESNSRASMLWLVSILAFLAGVIVGAWTL